MELYTDTTITITTKEDIGEVTTADSRELQFFLSDFLREFAEKHGTKVGKKLSDKLQRIDHPILVNDFVLGVEAIVKVYFVGEPSDA